MRAAIHNSKAAEGLAGPLSDVNMGAPSEDTTRCRDLLRPRSTSAERRTIHHSKDEQGPAGLLQCRFAVHSLKAPVPDLAGRDVAKLEKGAEPGASVKVGSVAPLCVVDQPTARAIPGNKGVKPRAPTRFTRRPSRRQTGGPIRLRWQQTKGIE